MRRSRLVVLGVCCVVVLLAAVAVYAYECHFWSNSTVQYYPGYGDVCGGWGSGCTECWNGQTGESCVEAGFSNCFQEENQLP